MNKLEPDTLQETLIDIVIPNYNGKQFLETCLSSILSQSFSSFEIIVVDNGSEDGSVEYIQERFPGVRLISLSENKGFSAAVNMGISSGKSPLVFLLNNDTELAPDCLEKLVADSEKYEDDYFAPKMLSYSERSVLDGAGDGFLRGGVGYRLGTMEQDGPAYNDSIQVFGACGGAALYRRSFFDKIGLFDEDFFAYLEDVDLNFRANRAGLTCRYVPGSRVYHIGSATTGSKINPFIVRLSTRNNLILLVKNYPISFWLRFFPAIVIYQAVWIAFVVKKRQFSAYCSGLRGFILELSKTIAKRKEIVQMDGIGNAELATRVLNAESDVVNSIMRRREAEGKGNLLLVVYKKVFL